MQLIKIFVEPNANDPRKVKLSAKCPLCGRDNELVVDKREFEEGYEKYCNGPQCKTLSLIGLLTKGSSS